MTTTAKILADSIAPNGSRLTTLELNFPMFVQPQLLRHRAFSFSVQSTRAVPLKEQIRRVRENPAMPVRWGAAQKGMVAQEEVSWSTIEASEIRWRTAANIVALQAEAYLDLGIHQEVAARLLMPFQWCRCIISATEWDNFFALRIDSHAQAEIRVLAEAIRDARDASTPRMVVPGTWHLPFIDDEDWAWAETQQSDVWLKLRLISAGRCARVSFLQHDGRRDRLRDINLGDRLAGDAHWSALEHQATPLPMGIGKRANFVGWAQHRSLYANESNRAAWLAAKESNHV